MSGECMHCSITKGGDDIHYWFNHYEGDIFCKRVVLCGVCVSQAFEGKTYEEFLQDVTGGGESVIKFPSTVINKDVVKSDEHIMGYHFCTTTTTTTVVDMAISRHQIQIEADGDGYIFISNSTAIDTLLQFLREREQPQKNETGDV